MFLNINIVNRCNLQCPSCPRGRGQLKSDRSEMSLNLFEAICERAEQQGLKLNEIQPYDNTEPTLHSNLPGIIAIAAKYAPRVSVSTNGNVKDVDWLELFRAGMTRVTISTSGVTQDTHGVTHYPSKFSTVLTTMKSIHEAWVAMDKKPIVEFFYLRYLNNLDEEAESRRIVAQFGFRFIPIWASTLQPDRQTNKAGCVISPEQAALIGRRYPIKSCYVLERNININHLGKVTMCAGFSHEIADWLTTPVKEIQRLRRADKCCARCRATGLVHYVCRNPHLDAYAAKIAGDCLAYRLQRLQHWAFYLHEIYLR